MLKVLAVVSGVAVLGAAGTSYALTRPLSKAVGTETYDVAEATAGQLATVGDLTVFFGHQSVGGNMMEALPDVYAAAGVEAAAIVRGEEVPAGGGPVILHTNIGRNGDPLGKIAAFDAAIRGGLGDVVDVAVLKLCYVDIVVRTDVEEVFATYRDTMAALERDYPDVLFVYSTVPLTVELDGAVARAKARVKSLLGRASNSIHPEHNVAREQYNSMIRAQFADTGRLFDIAAVQATDADGVQQVRSYDGATMFAMEQYLASDPGHLNPRGAAIVASAFVAVIADAVG